MENLFYETLMTSCHLLRTCTFFTYQEHCHFNVAVLLIVISAPQEDNFLPASPQWQFLIQSIKYQDLKPWSTSRQDCFDIALDSWFLVTGTPIPRFIENLETKQRNNKNTGQPSQLKLNATKETIFCIVRDVSVGRVTYSRFCTRLAPSVSSTLRFGLVY